MNYMSNQSNPLNNKENQAFRYIRNSLIHKGKSPSLREIMKELGYKSSLSPMLLVNKLIEFGYIKRSGRNLKILKELDDSQEHAQTVEIPLVGTAPCGIPFLAEEQFEMTIPVSIDIAKPGYKYFLLRAVGDSMDKEGIKDGNFVLVRQQQYANDGDIVVALIDNDATIKQFYKSKDTVVLKPNSTNNNHRSIIVNNNFLIQGKVINVIEDL